MRTEKEVRAAISHLREAERGAPDTPEGEFFRRHNAMVLDLLRWVLGEQSDFSAVVEGCDQVDRARRQ